MPNQSEEQKADHKGETNQLQERTGAVDQRGKNPFVACDKRAPKELATRKIGEIQQKETREKVATANWKVDSSIAEKPTKQISGL